MKAKQKKKKKPKGRQGRNKASRERARNAPRPPPNVIVCALCPDSEILEDEATGDTICTGCGLVVDRSGMNSSNYILNTCKCSPPYSRVVHWNQRVSQTNARGPKFSREQVRQTWEVLDDMMQGRTELPPKLSLKREELLDRAGRKTFGYIFEKVLGYPKKTANCWIQMRRRLQKYVHLPSVEKDWIGPALTERLRARYQCVEMAFEKILYLRKGEAKQKGSLKRKSIICINYIMAQLFLMEDPEKYEVVLPYLNQLSGKDQIDINNQRWKLLMDYCQEHFREVLLTKKMNNETQPHLQCSFDWPYNPMDTKNKVQCFIYFVEEVSSTTALRVSVGAGVKNSPNECGDDECE